MMSFKHMDMNMNRVLKTEVIYIIDHYLNSIELNICSDEIDKVELLFTKVYTDKLKHKICNICNKKYFILLKFISNDNTMYYDEEKGVYVVCDTLSLYSFRINKIRYYLLFSIIYDKTMPLLKREKIELFVKG